MPSIKLNDKYVTGTLISHYLAVAYQSELSGNISFLKKFGVPGSKQSSYSFGLFQFDIDAQLRSKNSNAVMQFLTTAGFNTADIENLRKHTILDKSVKDALDKKLADALKDSEGKAQAELDKLYVIQGKGLAKELQTRLRSLYAENPDAANQIYASEELQLRLMDFMNQFGVVNRDKLFNYLSGNPQEMYSGFTLGLPKGTKLDGSEINWFIKNTEFGWTHQDAAERRARDLDTALNSMSVLLVKPQVDVIDSTLKAQVSAVDQKRWYVADPATAVKGALGQFTGFARYVSGQLRVTKDDPIDESFASDGSQTDTWSEINGTRGSYSYDVNSNALNAQWTNESPGRNGEMSGSIVGSATEIKTSLTYPDGKKTVWRHNKDGSGGYAFYNSQGILVSARDINADGSYVDTGFIPDTGALDARFVVNVDGSQESRKYDLQGKLRTIDHINSDGSHSETWFYADGGVQHSYVYGVDGTHRFEEYYENGVLSGLGVLNADATAVGEGYSPDGSPIVKYHLDASGWKTETRWDSGVPHSSSFWDVPAVLQPITLRQIVTTTSEETDVEKYYANGNPSSLVKTWANGSTYVEKFFQTDTSPSSEEATNADGSSSLKTWYANSALASESEKRADGTYSYKTYNALGYLISDSWKLADGTNGTDSYKQDGESSGTSTYLDGSAINYTINADGVKTEKRQYLDGNYSVIYTDDFGVLDNSLYDANGQLIWENQSSVAPIYVLGAGHRTIPRAVAAGSLKFGSGIAYKDISFQQQGSSLLVTYSPTDSVLIQDDGTSGNGYPTLAFVDGTSATYSNNGTGGVTTTIQDSAGSSTYIFGFGSGNDTVIVGGGDSNTVQFSAGVSASDVTLSREGGNNLVLTLAGGADTMTLTNWYADPVYQVQRASFADGTVWDLTQMASFSVVGTNGDDWLLGGFGDEVFNGLAGNDSIAGGAGNDTYIFGFGSGHDTVYDYGDGNTVQMSEGVSATDVTLSRDQENNLVLTLAGGADSLTLRNDFWGLDSPIQQVTFADGTQWDLTLMALDVPVVLTGTGDDDVLVGGGGGKNIFNGQGGNDTLFGSVGNDTYVFGFGSGRDVVWDSAGADTVQMAQGVSASDVTLSRDINSNLVLTLTGGADTMTLSNWYGSSRGQVEQVTFADGTVWDLTRIATQGQVVSGTAGDDSLFGGDGNDVLNGLGGNDMLFGNGGNDTYVFGFGSGQDTVIDQQGINTVQMSAGVSASDVTLNRDANNNLVLSLAGGGDTLTMDRWYEDSRFQNAQVTFADGTVWNLTRMAANVPVIGTAGDDYLSGGNGQDTFNGLGGNDTLRGGAGNDTYVFGFGSGQDTVMESSAGGGESGPLIPAGFDTIKMEAGVSAAKVTMSRDGDDNLVLTLTGGADTLTLTNWFGNADSQVEQVTFADGTAWNLTLIASSMAPYSHATYFKDDQGDLKAKYYDDDWSLMGSSGFAGDGNGTFTATNYDAAGNVLGYSTIFDDSKGNTSTTILDANNVKLSDIWTKADGTHGDDTFNEDGASGGRTFNTDRGGSYSSYTNDGQGHITTRYYPGLYYDVAWYSNFVGDAIGNGTTTNYDADGTETGYSTSVNDGLGNTTTTNFDPSGTKLSVNWTKADGSSGGDDFEFDGFYVSNIDDGHGDTSSTSHYADGSYTTTVSDSKGDTTKTSFDAKGIKLSDNLWRRGDYYGDDTFAPDGTSTGRTFNADGSYSNYTNDGQGQITTNIFDAYQNLTGSRVYIGDAMGNGTTTSYDVDGNALGSSTSSDDGLGNTITTNYDVIGIKLSNSWTKADGTSGNDTFNGDGSYSSQISDGQGNVTTTIYDASGVRLSDSWEKADGSWGNHTFNNGATSGTIYKAEGGSSSSGDDGHGNTITKIYDVQNRLVQTKWSHADGSDGTISSTVYTADGGYSTYTNDGLGNVSRQSFDAQNRLIGDQFTHANGSSVAEVFDPLTGEVISSTMTAGAGANETLVGRTTQNTFVLNLGSGQAGIDDSVALLANGCDTLSFGAGVRAQDIGFIQQGTDVLVSYSSNDSVLIKNFDLYGINSAVLIGSLKFADGSSIGLDTGDSYDGPGTYSITWYDAQGGATRELWAESGGGHGTNTFGADGSRHYSGTRWDGTRYDDWRYADGSSTDSYFYTDGTSSGTAVNADGSYSSYTNDGVNTVTTNYFDVNDNLLRYSIAVDDGAGKIATQNFDQYGTLLDLVIVIASGRSVIVQDGEGGTATTNYDVNDNFVSEIDTWKGEDGSYGSDTYYADDSVEGTGYYPPGGGGDFYFDGAVTYVYHDDGQGHYNWTEYDANEVLLGSSTTLVAQSPYTYLGTLYDATGRRIRDWWGDDYVWGRNTYNADGSSSGESYSDIDYSSSAYVNDGAGKITTQNFDQYGDLLGSVIATDDGQGNTFATYFDANGVKLSDNWKRADGSTGSDTFNTGANHAPLLFGAQATLGSGMEDTAHTITLASLLQGVRDVDGDSLSVLNLSASHGSLSAFDTASASWTFTPDTNYNGTVSLSFDVSDGTASVAASQNLDLTAVNDAPTGEVVITGTAKQNETLTASSSLDDMDGLGLIAYQWTADGVAIEGATAITLVLSAAQVGKTISVAANYTDGQGTSESVTSTATAAVASAMPSFEGTSGANKLSGTTGADQLTGLAGNDTYVVNNAGDMVVESLDAGTDTVQSSVDYALGANVENLTLTGTAAVNGTGNELNNVLTGNAAGNTLLGWGGNDILRGGAEADVLDGGEGNDRLEGGLGADQMLGGSGNDVYVVDEAGDVVVELADEGTDTVQSLVDYTLGANVENLTLTGTAAINGSGNELNNVITGNAAGNTLLGLGGNDILRGGAEADVLDGGEGNDRLEGGLGADTYLFGRGEGQDTLVDTDATVGVKDELHFGSDISAEQIWLRKLGNNLEISLIGTSDKITVSNWYLGEDRHVEVLQLADGRQLLDSQVQNLVQAMASFSPPAAGQTTLPAGYESTLTPVIAANWQ